MKYKLQDDTKNLQIDTILDFLSFSKLKKMHFFFAVIKASLTAKHSPVLGLKTLNFLSLHVVARMFPIRFQETLRTMSG